MFSHFINSELELKILESRYAQELYELTDHQRNYLREWLPWIDDTRNFEETNEFIKASLKQFADNNGFQCGIFYKKKIVGCIGYHYMDWSNKKTSIGYWLGSDFQGLGIMTKSCETLVNYAFKELKLNRVEIRVGNYNLKSRAIPERLGFLNEGIIRDAEWLYDHFIDHVLYGMLIKDWK